MPLLAIATLGLLCAFAGGGVGAGLALAGGLEPSMAVVLSLPAAAAASYVGWRVTPVEKVQGPRRRTA